MKKRIKVRFNLGRGKNYLKWKIEYPKFDKFKAYDTMDLDRLTYNPRRLPYWVKDDGYLMCMDGVTVNEIGTVDYKLFITKN